MAQHLTPEQLSRLSKSKRKQYERRVVRETPDDKNLPNSWAKHRYLIAAGVAVLVLGSGWVYLTQFYRPEILPPTTMAGHIEVSPPSHILDEPIDIRVQKHMLEHADGDGPPGVVINYNCVDFACPGDLIPRLAEIVQKYPENVYLAPYHGMSVKIALTRLGKIETLDEFDKEAIRKFIESPDI